MNRFPQLSEARRLALLQPPAHKAHIILDTDTYNEIDDQFALVYALLSPERIELEAVYAAPFHNNRSNDPGHGMELSYEEILRVLERMGRSPEGFVFKGSRQWMTAPDQPVRSEAVEDLIARAKQDREEPLYVVGIGAITNVASAIVAAPEIIEKIVVVWLGGHPTYWHSANEFNLKQDLHASRSLFDSGVPLIWVPCVNVTEHLRTTLAELQHFVKEQGAIGKYLFEIFAAYSTDHYAYSKEIWDLGPLAWLVNPEWLPGAIVHSPVLSNQLTWSHDPRRHFVREIRSLRRDPIFADLFRKLERFHQQG